MIDSMVCQLITAAWFKLLKSSPGLVSESVRYRFGVKDCRCAGLWVQGAQGLESWVN